MAISPTGQRLFETTSEVIYANDTNDSTWTSYFIAINEEDVKTKLKERYGDLSHWDDHNQCLRRITITEITDVEVI